MPSSMLPSASSEPALESKRALRRWLVDENVAPQVARFLRDRGDDVLDLKEAGWFGKTDEEILTLAREEGRCVVTYDVDFVSIRRLRDAHPGIVFVRTRDLRPSRVVTVLEWFLDHYGNRDLRNNVAVIEDARVRFRRAAAGS